MPGQYQLSLDQLPAEAEELRTLGIPAVLLFGLPAAKDEQGSEAYDPEGIVQRAVRTLKQADADIVAPSDMMDGRVAAIRQALDDSGLARTPIMAYAAKQASAFYGPFRVAAESAPRFGDRKGYQMDPANAREALREIEADIEEGADIVMVKPALPNLDLIARAGDRFDLPLAAYNVSGEYAMVKAAAAAGYLEERLAPLGH